MTKIQDLYLKGKEGEFCTKYSPHSYMMALVDMGWSEQDAKNASEYYAKQVFIPTIERHRWLFKRKEQESITFLNRATELSDVLK